MATIYNDGMIRREDIQPKPRVAEVVVLHRDVYAKFESQFRLIQPNEQTSAIQVGYALGVQAVLKALRSSLVAE